MSDLEDTALARIDRLIGICRTVTSSDTSGDMGRAVYTGTMSVVCDLYGRQSPQAESLREINARVMAYQWRESMKHGTSPSY